MIEKSVSNFAFSRRVLTVDILWQTEMAYHVRYLGVNAWLPKSHVLIVHWIHSKYCCSCGRARLSVPFWLYWDNFDNG